MKSKKAIIATIAMVAVVQLGCNRTVKMKEKTTMICDPDTGICETPESDSLSQKAIHPMNQKTKLVYFTDPICSACWAIEPQLKKLKLQYAQSIDIEYHMGGLLPNWESMRGAAIASPSDVAHHWDEMSEHYKMPIDGDVWLEDPLSSSYPPSIAFKASEIQGEEKALLFLRRLREMVFVEKKNITKWDHISTAAEEVGLDTQRLKEDIENIGPKLFYQDLMLAKQMGVRGFPTVYVIKQGQDPVLIYGARPYQNYAQAIHSVDPSIKPSSNEWTPSNLIKEYPSLTVRELAELAEIDFEEAKNFLDEHVSANELLEVQTKNGSLYTKLP